MYRDYFQLDYTEVIEILSNEVIENDFSLIKISAEIPCGITGKIVDITSAAIGGATVGVFDADGNLLTRVITTLSGTYRIDNLEPGTYIVYAIKDGYNLSGRVSVTLTNGDQEIDNIVLYGYEYNTSIYGVLTDTSNNPLGGKHLVMYDANVHEENVILAEVFTASDGEYMAHFIAKSTIGVWFEIEENDYDWPGDLPLVYANPGELVNYQLEATKIAETPKGIMTGVLYDHETKLPITNGQLGLYKITETEIGTEEIMIKTTTSDDTGRYIFEEVDVGKYIIKAKSVKTIG